MKQSILNKYFLILLYLLLASCSGLNHLPKGDKLYTGAEIKLESTDKFKNKYIKSLAPKGSSSGTE